MLDKKSALAILAAATLFAVAGCGGSSGSDDAAQPQAATLTAPARTATAPVATGPAYVRAAWAVCEEINRRLSALPQPTSDPEKVAVLERVIEVRRAGEKRLARVAPDSADVAAYRRFVAVVREQTDTFERLRDATRTGDQTAASIATASSQDLNTEQNDAARRLGIDGCATD